jgi:molybdate transport system substrate-binding protein
VQRRHVRRFWPPILALGFVVPACGDDGRTGERELLVLAASSLAGAFEEVEAAFEDAHPGLDVVLTVDSSSTLAGQVAEGAPAAVLATADEATMATAVEPAGTAMTPRLRANTTGSPATAPESTAVADPADLEGDVTLALCAPGVPCRIVADALFDALGIAPEVDSEEENVAAVATKVAAGEVDAGVVYVTDDLASDDIEALDLGDVQVTTDYPIAAVSDDDDADAFVEFVTGPDGRAILDDAGFLLP